MTGYILDTNIAVRALKDPDLLTAPVRDAILAGPNIRSVAPYWEVVIKSVKGKLHVGDPRIWWRRALEDLVATALRIRPEHVTELYNRPPFHGDPFDRVLIAQATVEGLAMLTTDEVIASYTSERFCVIS